MRNAAGRGSGEVVADPVHAVADPSRVQVGRPVRSVGHGRQPVEVDEGAVAGVLEVELLRPVSHLETHGTQQRGRT